jgi:hypothetical protein
MVIGAVVSALAVGFSGGFFLFRLKQHWCRECGTTLNCPLCDNTHRLDMLRG